MLKLAIKPFKYIKAQFNRVASGRFEQWVRFVAFVNRQKSRDLQRPKRKQQLRFFGKKTKVLFDMLLLIWEMVPPRAIFVVLCEDEDLDQQSLWEDMSRLSCQGYLCQVNTSKRLRNICQEQVKALLASGPPEWSMPQWIILTGS